MAFVEGYRSVCKFESGPRSLAVIWKVAVVEGWPLRGVPLYCMCAAAVCLTHLAFCSCLCRDGCRDKYKDMLCCYEDVI